MCESMCDNERYLCKEGDFRLITTGSFRIAQFYIHKQYMSMRPGDLQYLTIIFHVIQNQLNVYTLSLSLSLPDVLSYVTVTLTSVNYVEQAPNACKHILYSQLFDELKTTF